MLHMEKYMGLIVMCVLKHSIPLQYILGSQITTYDQKLSGYGLQGR